MACFTSSPFANARGPGARETPKPKLKKEAFPLFVPPVDRQCAPGPPPTPALLRASPRGYVPGHDPKE
eukprot:7950238-Pyramimonas_sp.AAC.1